MFKHIACYTPPLPHYNQVQCLSLEIGTGFKIKGTPDAYKGLTRDTADETMRLKVLLGTLFELSRSESVDPGSDTLKILVLPEFFFRGRSGGYTVAQTQALIEKINTLLKRQELDHWVVIPGTIVGYSQTENNTTRSHPVFEAYNIAPIVRCGTNDAPPHLVLKKWKSDADFITRPVPGTESPDPLLTQYNTAYLDTLPGREARPSRPESGDPVTQVGNLTLGVEICLDHRLGRLKHLVDTEQIKPVDIQIIVANQQKIYDHKKAIHPKGLLFRVDGSVSGSSTLLKGGRNIHAAKEIPFTGAKLASAAEAFLTNSIVAKVYPAKSIPPRAETLPEPFQIPPDRSPNPGDCTRCTIS